MELARLSQDLGLSTRITWIDAVPNVDLAHYYASADVFCTPSRWEGFGIVFVEAMAAGSVVVTSNVAPMNEFISHRKSGILVDDHENPEVDKMKNYIQFHLQLLQALVIYLRRSLKGLHRLNYGGEQY